MMVEAGANELSEETMLKAILFGHEAIKEIVAFQETIVAKVGKPKMEKAIYEVPTEIDVAMREYITEQLKIAVANADKHMREENIKQVKSEATEHFLSIYPENAKDISNMFQKILKEIVRKMITVDKIRPDGRQIDEVRPITCEVGLLARTHGSGLFTRGQTQVFTITTLGAIGDEQILDGLGVEESKRYMHSL